MSPRRVSHLCLIAVLLSGCAAAAPGYVPPDSQSARLRAAAPRGGGFEATGAYVLSEQEQKLDCKGLTGGITVKILQLREAGNRTAPTAAAKVTADAMRPFRGGTSYAQDLAEDARRDRARLEALNARLVEKGCKSFDLEAALKPGNTEVPRPTIGGRTKG